MKAKAKGTRAERRVCAWLAAAGYVPVRAAGSFGLFDVVAVNATTVKFITIKCGHARLSAQERAAVAAVAVPPGCTKEYWHLADYARAAAIESLP